MAVDFEKAKADAVAKKEIAKKKIIAAKHQAETMKFLKKNPPPIYVDLPEPSGDIEQDSIDDLDAVQSGFRARMKAEDGRKKLAVDSEYWACVCFQTREQKEAFLSALNILEFGDKYIDGQLVANRLGIVLPVGNIPYNPEPRIDRDWLSFTLE